jgi:YcaO-like protein with predicted kinase domain
MSASHQSKPWGRTRPLTEIAAALESSAKVFGVARVGSVTRLDNIGIATATAFRLDPIGESISVCTGKGASELEARVGALAEALERYCAEPRRRIATVAAKHSELDGALAPRDFILPDGVQDDAVIDWCRGFMLAGTEVWVPANAVFFPYAPSPRAARLFASQTTGLATGATNPEALVFALLECIERDAYSRAVALASVGRGEEIPVLDLADVKHYAGVELEALQSHGLHVLIRNLRCDTQVPAYLCTIHDGAHAHTGVAARPEAVQAVRAAMQEAAQSRLTDIQGAREDLPQRRREQVDPWFLFPGDAPTVDLDPGWTSGNIEEVLMELNARLVAVEPAIQAACVDLTLEGVELAVVRAVTPGLEVWALDPARVGPRASTWLCQPE